MSEVSRPCPTALQARRAGVLLHPTCLPGQYGVLGSSARRFMDFLAEAGVSVWQMLPVGPTHRDLSPYQSLSAYAGNQDLIDLEDLLHWGLLTDAELAGFSDATSRNALFELAAGRFHRGDYAPGVDYPELSGYEAFIRHNSFWLHDYALFQALREDYPVDGWQSWPRPLRDREPAALQAFAQQRQGTLERIRFEQFVFFHQWHKLRRYGNEKGLYLFGDIPIFVAHDSADVWSRRDQFKLDPDGAAIVVAGVPPDYFSPRGQHWGNPIYDWSAMAVDGFRWWLDRLGMQRELFDIIRLDHFRGLQAYWEIPATDPEPVNGCWVSGPGQSFLSACFEAFPDLPLVAENLGIIGAEVENLRHDFQLPGMTVLQFGFDGSPHNPHLPHNHKAWDLVYTGTHDNDTTLGWYRSLDERTRDYVNRYTGHTGSDMPWELIRMAMASVSVLAVVPLQDLLALDSDARFNTPGTAQGNWLWQLSWDSCTPALASRLRHLLGLYGRLP